MSLLFMSAGVLLLGAAFSGCMLFMGGHGAGMSGMGCGMGMNGMQHSMTSSADSSNKTHGVVRAIDVNAKTITLEHGDIPGVMAAMTMAYGVARPELLQKISVNDRVRFTLSKVETGEYVISSIEKEQL